MFQLTAARRRLVKKCLYRIFLIVRFNSQPPEDGWRKDRPFWEYGLEFQLTAARRRLDDQLKARTTLAGFQLTAARRRLVDQFDAHEYRQSCFNSQPPEDGWMII